MRTTRIMPRLFRRRSPLAQREAFTVERERRRPRRDLIDRPFTPVTPADVPLEDRAVPPELDELIQRMTTSETITVEELMARRARREAEGSS